MVCFVIATHQVAALHLDLLGVASGALLHGNFMRKPFQALVVQLLTLGVHLNTWVLPRSFQSLETPGVVWPGALSSGFLWSVVIGSRVYTAPVCFAPSIVFKAVEDQCNSTTLSGLRVVVWAGCYGQVGGVGWKGAGTG